MPTVTRQQLSLYMIRGDFIVSWTLILPTVVLNYQLEAACYDVAVLLIEMTEEKRKSVRVWCDGWYGILFNVSCILPGAQKNVLCMVYVVKLPNRWG